VNSQQLKEIEMQVIDITEIFENYKMWKDNNFQQTVFGRWMVKLIDKEK